MATRSGQIEVTVAVIKPEEIAGGRAQAIYSSIERFCKENGLELESRSIVLERPILERHYLGKGGDDIERISKKVSKVMREHEIPFDDERSAALQLLRAHIDGYDGKPAIVVRISGPDAIEKINALKGSTDPCNAAPETIRGQFSTGVALQEYLRGSMSPVRNIIHIPETQEEAAFDVQTFWEMAPSLVGLERKEPAQ